MKIKLRPKPSRIPDRIILAIDPGTEFGAAAFDKITGRLLSTRVFIGRGNTWRGRVDDALWRFEQWLMCDPIFSGGSGVIHTVYIEEPAFMAGAARGRSSARRGDLVKLCIATGRIWQTADRYTAATELIGIAKWKGQLKKHIVNARIKARIPKVVRRAAGMSRPPSHDWDAVGLGLFVLGNM